MHSLKISAFIDRENKSRELEMDSGSKVADLLDKLGINPVTVIVSRNDELILEDEELNNKDNILILSVISGG